MNYSYEVFSDGYIILSNGIPCLDQRGYVLHPHATMEESAQAHIDEIIAAEEASKQEGISIKELQEKSISQQETIDELTILVAELLMGGGE